MVSLCPKSYSILLVFFLLIMTYIGLLCAFVFYYFVGSNA